jgi:hypothetical protein
MQEILSFATMINLYIPLRRLKELREAYFLLKIHIAVQLEPNSTQREIALNHEVRIRAAAHRY